MFMKTCVIRAKWVVINKGLEMNWYSNVKLPLHEKCFDCTSLACQPGTYSVITVTSSTYHSLNAVLGMPQALASFT